MRGVCRQETGLRESQSSYSRGMISTQLRRFGDVYGYECHEEQWLQLSDPAYAKAALRFLLTAETEGKQTEDILSL